MKASGTDLLDVCSSTASRGTACMMTGLALCEALIFYGLSLRVQKSSRGFYMYAFMLMLFPALAYSCLLSGYGLTDLGAPDGDRCFFAARWLMLCVELPMMMLCACFLAGMASIETGWLVLAALGFAVSSLIGGKLNGSVIWVMFVESILFAIPMIGTLWNRFMIKEGDASGYEHEYVAVIARRLACVCSNGMLYVVFNIVIWLLAQGAGVISNTIELLALVIADIVFISIFALCLVSDRETTEKMAEFQARGAGWMRSGGEYASIETGGSGSGMGGGRTTGAPYGTAVH